MSQEGKQMICPEVEDCKRKKGVFQKCVHSIPHIYIKGNCGMPIAGCCPACIPYTPKEKEDDELEINDDKLLKKIFTPKPPQTKELEGKIKEVIHRLKNNCLSLYVDYNEGDIDEKYLEEQNRENEKVALSQIMSLIGEREK